MSNRENSTKIFISSTAQETLQPLRQKLKNILDKSGHKALLFEENFGLWSDNTLLDCLRKVSESDVYVLFISNESGSFTGIDPNITATYAEYLRALEEQKIIVPFVETHILDIFREHIKTPLGLKIQDYKERFDREPDYTYDIVKKMVEEEKEGTVLYEKLNKSNIHSFQWAFIYDIYTKQWTYNAPLAQTEDSCQFIIEAMSQILKTLAPYYPLMNHINEAIATADRLTEFKKAIPQFMQFLRAGELNIKNTLYTLSMYLRGGNIKHNDSPLDNRVLAHVSDCNAICLYKRVGEKLHLINFSGQVTPESEYDIKDPNSFVASTYNLENEDVENVFYSEEKQQIYMTKKIGDLVLSVHFRLSEKWSETRVMSYEGQILRAIMNKRDQFDFAIDLIGGMLNE
jgi:hypothetical protein